MPTAPTAEFLPFAGLSLTAMLALGLALVAAGFFALRLVAARRGHS